MVEHSSDKRKVPGPIPGARTMANYYTKEGIELLKIRIKEQEERIRIAQKEAAEAAGVSYDWHDNFGAEEATRQAEAETTKLFKLKGDLKNAVIIEPEEQNEKVKIGTTVAVQIDGKESELTIGAGEEADPAKSLISYISTMADQLLGMKVGESKNTIVGGVKRNLEVKKIFPPSYKYRKLVTGR